MYPRSKAAPMDWQRETELAAPPMWNVPAPPQPAPAAADVSVPDVDMPDLSVLPPEREATSAPEPAPAPMAAAATACPNDDEERRPRVFEKNHLFRATRTRGAVERVRGLRHRRSNRALAPSGGPSSDNGDDDRESVDDADDHERVGDASLSRAAGTAINYFFSPPVPPSVPAPTMMSQLDWPEVLLGYAQFVFNALILAGILWVAYIVLSTITSDVRERVEETTFGALHEVKQCSSRWNMLKCGSPEEVPILYHECRDLELCMARNPSVVGRTTVAASLLADTLNTFVDSLSWKTTLFLLALIALFVRAANSFFAYFRVQSAQRRSKRTRRSADGHGHGHGEYSPAPAPRRAVRTRTAPPAVPWHADDSVDVSADATSS